MLKRPQTSRAFHVTLYVALVAICALAVVAQSGRRARKPEPAPAPSPEATPTPPPAQKPKPPPTFTFIVGLDGFGDFNAISPSIYTGVLRNCAGRLDSSIAVKAEIGPHDMSRADAIRQAKSEKETYVVWIRLRPNTVSGETGVPDDPNNVFIEYWVFAPTTAKVATTGNTFPEAYRNKVIRVPTSGVDGDYYLNQAARGAAERILDHFHLLLPPNTQP
jgi:hypothetical protein